MHASQSSDSTWIQVRETRKTAIFCDRKAYEEAPPLNKTRQFLYLITGQFNQLSGIKYIERFSGFDSPGVKVESLPFTRMSVLIDRYLVSKRYCMNYSVIGKVRKCTVSRINVSFGLS